MALIFAEHCDSWAVTDFTTRYNALAARGWIETGSAQWPWYNSGRMNGGCFLRDTLDNDSYTRGYYQVLSASISRIHSAFWWWSNPASPVSNAHYVSRLAIGGNYCGVYGNTTNLTRLNLAVPIGAGGLLVGTCTTNVVNSAWHFIEYEIALDPTAGTAKMWVDGALEVNFTGATSVAAAPLALTRWFMGPDRAHSVVDDFLLWDSTDIGDGWTTNLGGGVRILKVVRPTSDASVQFTPSTGTTNYTLVNEIAPSTTNYVQSATDGHTDRYGFAAHGLTNTPQSVIVENFVRNPGAGLVNHRAVAELGGTIVESAAIATPGGWAVIPRAFPEKPGGGVWTLDDISNATFGIRVDVP